MTLTYRRWRSRIVPYVLLCLIALIAACQPQEPIVPTVRPEASETQALQSTMPPLPSPSVTALFTPSGVPTMRPMISVTPGITPSVAVIAVQPSATFGPKCYTVRAGDTLLDLIYRAGYGTLSVLEEVRRLNNISGNNITEGQQVCVPAFTMTPTPPGYEATAAAIATFVPQTGPLVTATYTVKKDDTVFGIMFEKGVSLRLLCALNQPYDLINCASCKLDSDPPECRPLLREGQILYIPGVPPTATITPTLTRSETPTATPGYPPLALFAPTMGKLVNGPAQLMWMPAGVLRPDEYYLLTWFNAVTGVQQAVRVRESSYRLPADQQPSDGTAHTVNWRVWIAREVDGQDVLLNPDGPIYTFLWASR